ncbi:hypothetical protein E2562_034246 [Oryza meyeriana var. granulata]|uniref:Uncharacterized protein n=1 Tax=Oryza meyeriana var. granulata TaxID=110450 RepID=A0A6G1CC42_9ORYZ|nr:hypothetical protein E2562_034246 [Oryza meyeriana var. granulata]
MGWRGATTLPQLDLKAAVAIATYNEVGRWDEIDRTTSCVNGGIQARWQGRLASSSLPSLGSAGGDGGRAVFGGWLQQQDGQLLALALYGNDGHGKSEWCMAN